MKPDVVLGPDLLSGSIVYALYESPEGGVPYYVGMGDHGIKRCFHHAGRATRIDLWLFASHGAARDFEAQMITHHRPRRNKDIPPVVPTSDVRRRARGGESIASIARAMNVTRPTITRRLAGAR